MLDYSPTKTQKLLGNPDKSANPTVSSPACAGLAGEHCIRYVEVCASMSVVAHLMTISLIQVFCELGSRSISVK